MFLFCREIRFEAALAASLWMLIVEDDFLCSGLANTYKIQTAGQCRGGDALGGSRQTALEHKLSECIVNHYRCGILRFDCYAVSFGKNVAWGFFGGVYCHRSTLAEAGSQHQCPTQYAGLPFGAGKVENLRRSVVVAVEAEIDIVGSGLFEAHVDGAITYQRLFEYVAHIAVEALKEGFAPFVVLIDDVARMSVVVVPDGDVKTDVAVLVGIGTVKIEL